MGMNRIILLSCQAKRALMRKNGLLSIAAWLLMSAFVCSSVVAHDLPMNSIMNAFVKGEPKQIELVVRIPLDLLRGLPFSVKDSQYDVAASEPAAQLASTLLEDGFVLLENDVRLTVLALMLPALALFRRLMPERAGIIMLSAVVALVGGYWMVERWQVLSQTQWPRLDGDAALGAVRWGAVALLVLVVLSALSKLTARKSHRRSKAIESGAAEGRSRATTSLNS